MVRSFGWNLGSDETENSSLAATALTTKMVTFCFIHTAEQSSGIDREAGQEEEEAPEKDFIFSSVISCCLLFDVGLFSCAFLFACLITVSYPSSSSRFLFSFASLALWFAVSQAFLLLLGKFG